MKFVVDAQLFQTSTWHRGMGKYSLELLKALQEEGFFEGGELELVLNKNLKLEKEREEVFTRLFPGVNFKTVDLRLTNAINLQKTQEYNRKKLTEVYKGQDVTFLILSSFENEVTSVFPENATKLLIAYDLIPLFFYDRYLSHNQPVRNNYFGRFNTVFEADHIFAISQTTKDDYTRRLGLPLSKVTNIKGARIGMNAEKSQPQYVSKRKFIISPSGDDQRKNNERMITAFEEFNKKDKQYELLITSNFSPQTQKVLKTLSKDIHFVGNVSEEELRWYYHNAEMVLFVPEYEGLGLPVLEGVEEGQKVVCSNISVFRELTEKDDTFYFCDPYSPRSIQQAIEQAANNTRPVPTDEYEAIKATYTWSNSAKVFINAYKQVSPKKAGNRKKIAVLGPHPAGKSAIGKVLEVSHYALSEHADVDYYLEIPKEDFEASNESFIDYVTSAKSVNEFNSHVAEQYDDIIYHIGSSTYHLRTIINALAIPGITIMHDTRFEAVFNIMVEEKLISQSRLEAERKLDELLKTQETSDHIVSLINAADVVVVHSKFTKKAAEKCLINKVPVEVAGLPVGMTEAARRTKNVRPKIAMAGIISPTKGLKLLTSLLDSGQFNDCDFALFGYDYAVDRSVLSSLSGYPNLEVKRNLTDIQFRQELETADVLLNYRDYYHGETSYATLEAMRVGVVPLVRDIGWFSELPDKVAVKVGSPDDVAHALRHLMNSKKQLYDMSSNAYDYVAQSYAPSGYAQTLSDLINS